MPIHVASLRIRLDTYLETELVILTCITAPGITMFQRGWFSSKAAQAPVPELTLEGFTVDELDRARKILMEAGLGQHESNLLRPIVHALSRNSNGARQFTSSIGRTAIDQI